MANTFSAAVKQAMHNVSVLQHVIRRNGDITIFDMHKIAIAMHKAFLAVEGEQAANSTRVHDTISKLLKEIVVALSRHATPERPIHIEEIQDQVELALMRSGEQQVARSYVLYREQRRTLRDQQKLHDNNYLLVTLADGSLAPLDLAAIHSQLEQACYGLADVTAQEILKDVQRNLFNKVPIKEVQRSLIMSARTLIEQEPNYSYVAARLLLDTLYAEAREFLQLPTLPGAQQQQNYADYFMSYLNRGVERDLLHPELLNFNLAELAQEIVPARDLQFNYLGLQILYDRYFIHATEVRFELPQAFFMRVAMGLALKEQQKEKWAIKFYHLLSSFHFMSSTPTLFNSGTLRPQLSSCYLTTVPDDLDGIYSALKDNALLSKYAGGLGNDWSNVRALGAKIKGTNGKSQGVVPFLSVANATAVAVNQGGKRKGAVCAYLETWHKDIEEFLELRKNTGDERRRTHDMNTANWIPDLFMHRVINNQEWTLFSPDEAPLLHGLYGKKFVEAYLQYEEQANLGLITNWKRMPAVNLWRKMLTMLFETGHPWITFKDPCNLRSPQQHVGVVHSSNLCTEITLNTAREEIAVCNLGSINLAEHLSDQQLDTAKLQNTVNIAIRMLDNVIDINYYAVPQARQSNLKHRPIGLGLMGFQDALYQLRLPYASDAAVEFADRSTELISYYAIAASTDLAAERGTYSSFQGSLWSKGILPIDSLEILAEQRGQNLVIDKTQHLPWDQLRQRVMSVGMRNSNVLAIAPTATIANICGVSQSIEPTYQNLFVKSNLSGEFTIINPYLIADLKNQQLWDNLMVKDLKYYNGSLLNIERIPSELKKLYATAFEVDPTWLIEAGARRQKWLDQAQSLNLYVAEPSGKKLDSIYRLSWVRGLKTNYYLRTLGATNTEKATIHDNMLNAVNVNMVSIKECSITDADCEACQ